MTISTSSADPGQPAAPSAIRASDADREETVGELRRHHAEGRLSLEELDARAGAAYQARTVGELAPLLGDLPAPVPPPPPPPSRWNLAARFAAPIAIGGGIVAVAALVHHAQFIGFWPIIGFVWLRRVGWGGRRGRVPPAGPPRRGGPVGFDRTRSL